MPVSAVFAPRIFFALIQRSLAMFRRKSAARAASLANELSSTTLNLLMPRNSADVLVETLENWGVEVVFGLPGDGINGIMEALRKRKDRIRFIQTRHEEAAAFAAVGYAKFSGKLGVCLATTGPGATNLLTGLYDAQMDQIPVLAITGLPYHDLIGTHYQQDIATD